MVSTLFQLADDKLITTALTVLVIFLTIAAYFSERNRFRYFEKFNLKTPPTLLIFGNLHSFLLRNPTIQRVDWAKKYGRVYGFFWNKQPRLVIGDANILQDISIRDFDTFVNHSLNIFSNKYQDQFLIHLKDDQWRRVRALMTPVFTSSKIRAMFRLLEACSNDLVNNCQSFMDENFGIVNVKDLFNLYTMDAIASCCFGIKLGKRPSKTNRTYKQDDSSTSFKDDFVHAAMLIMELSYWRILVATFCPEWFIKLTKFQAYPEKYYHPIARKTAEIIKLRRRLPVKLMDYLQSLLDTTLKSVDERTHSSLKSDDKLRNSDTTSSDNDHLSGLSLTDEEILCGSIFFLVVGMETTGNLLSSSLYCLAFHQDIQEKLYDEIKSIAIIKNNKENQLQYQFDFDTLSSAKYLDAFIYETLRYIPPVGSIDRVASKDYFIEQLNITIPKGTILDLAYDAIMKDSEYWPEPHTFNPDRFLPHNKQNIVPGTFCAFGLGPRHCLGLRFALTEAKLGLAKLIMQYRFEAAPSTNFPPELAGHISLTWLKNPSVRILSRTTNQ